MGDYNQRLLDGILWDITLIKQQIEAVEFLYAYRACNEDAHLVACNDPLTILRFFIILISEFTKMPFEAKC